MGKEKEVQIDEMEEFAAEGHGQVQVHKIEEEGHRIVKCKRRGRQMVSPSSEEKDYYKESFIRMIIISQLYLGVHSNFRMPLVDEPNVDKTEDRATRQDSPTYVIGYFRMSNFIFKKDLLRPNSGLLL